MTTTKALYQSGGLGILLILWLGAIAAWGDEKPVSNPPRNPIAPAAKAPVSGNPAKPGEPAPLPSAGPAGAVPPAGTPPNSLVPGVNPEPSRPLNFRTPAAGLNSGETSIQPVDAPRGEPGLQELLEKRDSLENEIRTTRTRVETDRRKVEVLRTLGKAEESDRLAVDIRDSDARLRNAREELRMVQDDLARIQQSSTEIGGSAGEEVILPGNNLEVWVNEDTSFNGRYQVRRGGYVVLPQVGRVWVAGKTISQAEASVRKVLLATQLHRATVMIERFEGPSEEAGPLIYLSGEFRTPRPYRIPAGTAPTLISVILGCGGTTERADLAHVKVMRVAGGKSMVEEVNVKKILEGTAANGLGNDLTLTEGDVVVVPPGSLNLIYVTGRVKKPGSYKVGENEKLTVYGAILQSGGFDHFAKESGVHVLRAMPDGTKAKLPVNIQDVKSGRRPDVILQPNDIVVVPEKFFSL